MLRFTTAVLALIGLIAAGPAYRQPIPATVLPQGEVPDPTSPNAQKGQEERDRAGKAFEERNQGWDAKTKKTMDTICRGC